MFDTFRSMLQIALDTQAVADHFKQMFPSFTLCSETPIIIGAKLLDYKPGRRGLIRYEIKGEQVENAGRGSEGRRSDPLRGRSGRSENNCIIFGKLYAQPNRAERIYETMKSLYDTIFSDAAPLGVPQPLGYMPQLSMLVYLPVKGNPLDQVLAGDQATFYMNLAGMWLGTLHQHRIPLKKHFQFVNEFDNIQKWVKIIAGKYPEEAKPAETISRHLQEQVEQIEFETNIPIHKDFHYGHVIIGGKLRVIDFDEMRLGDANFDLAHFCANLRLLGYRHGNASSQFPTFQNAFLNGYDRYRRWKPNECFRYFYAYTCLKIARQLCTMSGPHPRPTGKEQKQQVQFILQQGVAVQTQSMKKTLESLWLPANTERLQ